MAAATWHGTLDGVELANGEYLALPRVALGSVDGVGLVTALSLADLKRGAFLTAPRGVATEPIRAVHYLRRRRGAYPGWRWRHELKATALASLAHGPVFVSLSPERVARVCARPPGDFICKG